MSVVFSNEFSVFGEKLETLLDSKPSSKGNWFDISVCTIDEERKYIKLAIQQQNQKSSTSDIVILFDNITWFYYPSGVAADRFVHPAAATGQQELHKLCALRVTGGTKMNQTQQTVNHLGSYVVDIPILLSAKSADHIDRFAQSLLPLLKKIHDPSIVRTDIQYETAPTSSPGFLKTFARTLVSRQKKRFTEGNFNLDLAYISSNVIAMGYPTPSVETESNYRNDMNDVFRFFATRHRDQFWVINLCSERAFPPSSFNGRFSRLPFEDHEAPPIRLLFDICQGIEMFLATGRPMIASIQTNALAPFLTAEERSAFWRKSPPGPSEDLPGACGRVVAVHCKAGKGRTGVTLSAWIFYERLMRALHAPGVAQNAVVPPDVEECARLFGDRRTQDGSGVTIVSQMRFLRYFSRCCVELGMSLPPTIRPVRINSVAINATPALDGKGGSRLFVVVRTLRNPQIWERMGRREWLGKGMKTSALNSPNLPRMNQDEQANLVTVADSRVIVASLNSPNRNATSATSSSATNNNNSNQFSVTSPPVPEWIVAGSRIILPLGDVEVEDEFHISVWHSPVAGDGTTKKKKTSTADTDDEGGGGSPNSPGCSSPLVLFNSSNNSATPTTQYLSHGAKGEFMACACWIHSSFLEFPHATEIEQTVGETENNANATDNNIDNNDGTGRSTTVSLGLRQLDGCSKGKTMELFEENFGIDIEFTSCKPRARARS